MSETVQIEFHRAHGPYVSQSGTSENPCGHPRLPCQSVNSALIHFSHRMSTADDERWATERYLRIAMGANPYGVSDDGSSDVFAVTGIGIVGGYTAPSPATNADWAPPPADSPRLDLFLDPGIVMVWNGTNADPSANRLENVRLVGGQGNGADVLTTTNFFRSAVLTNAEIVGAEIQGPLSRGVSAMFVGVQSTVTLGEKSIVTGVRSDVPQDQPGGSPVFGVVNQGTLFVDGEIVGALNLDAPAGLATPAGSTGLALHTGSTTTLSATASITGGVAPQVTGIRMDGGNLTAVGAFVRGGIIQGSATQTQSAVGLEAVGSPTLAITGGLFEGGANANTAIGVQLTLFGSGGSVSMGDGVFIRSGANDNETAQSAHGLKINQTAPASDVTVNVTPGGLSTFAYPTQDGSAVRLRAQTNGSLVVQGTTSDAILSALTDGDGTPDSLIGIEIADPTVSVLVNVNVDVSGDATDRVVGIESVGAYVGTANVNVDGSDDAPLAEGIRCGLAAFDVDGNGPIVPEGATTTINLIGGVVEASDGAVTTRGALAGIGCAMTISELTLDADGNTGQVIGLGIRGGTVVWVGGEIDVDGLANGVTHKGVEMDCWNIARLEATGTTFDVDGQENDVFAEALTGISLNNSGAQPPCTDAAIHLTDAMVDVKATSDVSGSKALGIDGQAADGSHNMEIKIVNSEVSVGSADVTAALDLDLTNALVWLQDAVITGNTGPGGTNSSFQRVGMKLEFRNTLPVELVAWNSLFRMQGPPRRSSAIYLFADNNVAPLNPVPVYLVHNSIVPSNASGARGIRVDAKKRLDADSTSEWEVIQLMANLILAQDASGIQELCSYDADNNATTYAQVSQLPNSVDVIQANGPERFITQGGPPECVDIPPPTGGDHANILREATLNLVATHCVANGQPGSDAVATSSVSTFMNGRAFGSDYTAVDHRGCVRRLTEFSDVGRCESPCTTEP